MKRLLSFLLAVTLVLSCVPTVFATEQATTTPSVEYTYSIYDDEVTITGVTSPVRGNITIPSTLEGYPVTTIGYDAFYHCEELTGVTIPDSVTNIGAWAFAWCTSLTSVTIPDSVTSIDAWAFENCTSLTSVTIPYSATKIDYGLFNGCTSLTKISVDSRNPQYSTDSNGVLYNKNKSELIQMPGGYSGDFTIPGSVTQIAEYSFYECKNLTGVTIPNSVISVGYHAFAYCENMKSATIGNSVINIAERAFAYCDRLATVSIPDSVETIGEGAFAMCDRLTSASIGSGVTSMDQYVFGACTALKTISVDPKNPKYCSDSSGVLYNKDKTELVCVPGGYSGKYNIPNTVTDILNYALSSCYDLTDVTIPNSVLTIGDCAFSVCNDLTSVTIPKSVTSIGSYVFGGCPNLKGIFVDPNNAYYSNDSMGVLFNKDKTELVQMPSSFSGKYTIPSTVKVIGEDAFAYINLTGVIIPKSVTTISDSAFFFCDELTQLTIPNSVTSIGDHAFAYCDNIKSVTIGNSVTTISYWAFGDWNSLKEVNYTGTPEQWKAIEIDEGNEVLYGVPMYFVRFPDVRDNTWYYNAVEFAVEKGYFSGNDDGTFAPSKNITRQDFVVVLSRIAGANLSKYSGKTGFADVPANAYYAKAIHWATDNGIISGYNATTFGVGDSLTREQLVTILSRYAQKKGVNITPDATALDKMNSYKDASKINPYMKNAIAWALQKKVISGMNGDSIAPQGNATRAQVAAILMNINAYKVIPGI